MIQLVNLRFINQLLAILGLIMRQMILVMLMYDWFYIYTQVYPLI